MFKMTDFMGMVLQGFFMGVGSASGLWFYEWWVKPRLEKAKAHASSVGDLFKKKDT